MKKNEQHTETGSKHRKLKIWNKRDSQFRPKRKIRSMEYVEVSVLVTSGRRYVAYTFLYDNTSICSHVGDDHTI